MVEKAGLVTSIQLTLGVREAFDDFFLGFGPPASQPLLKLGQARGRHENISAGELDRAAGTAPLYIDVENTDFARLLDLLDSCDAGAVEIAVHVGVLKELACLYVCLHLRNGHKVVVNVILFAIARLSRSVAHTEAE